MLRDVGWRCVEERFPTCGDKPPAQGISAVAMVFVYVFATIVTLAAAIAVKVWLVNLH
jgi:hypothetical protein